jgi:hypothetical protein
MKKSVQITGWAVVLMFWLALFAVQAGAESGSAQSLLKETVNNVITILDREDLSEGEKSEKIEKLVDPVFDYELMARLTLGRETAHDGPRYFSSRIPILTRYPCIPGMPMQPLSICRWKSRTTRCRCPWRSGQGMKK